MYFYRKRMAGIIVKEIIRKGFGSRVRTYEPKNMTNSNQCTQKSIIIEDKLKPSFNF